MTTPKLSRRGFLLNIMVNATALSLANCSRIRPSYGSSSKPDVEWNYPQEAIRLNANENPLGPSSKAIKAMERALVHAHRYTHANPLRKALASYHEVSDEMILVGCGSTEILRIAPWAFLRNGSELVSAFQTYQVFIRECRKIGVTVNAIHLNKGFSFDLDSMRKAVTSDTKMIYLVNPNNPTGTCLGFEEVEAFCASLPGEAIVLLDEAYSHFLNDKNGRDGITLIKSGYNLIVTRTFSKAHGMAGMRLGYAVSSSSNIQTLSEYGLRDLGINQAGFAGAMASLEDENHVKKYKELVHEGREFYHNQFNAMGLEYIPGETPFLMVKLNMPSKAVQRQLMAKNVFVRKGDDWYMPGYLRISIGFTEENRACVTAFKNIL